MSLPLHPLRPLLGGAAALLLAAGLVTAASPSPSRADDATPAPPSTATPTATATAAPVATPRTYFINCKSGPARGVGTEVDPWTSVAFVGRHGAFLPGERVLLKRGTTCAGRITPRGSGTKAAPIVLGAYGSGRVPVVNGGGTKNGTGTVQLDDSSWWTVRDLRITNTGKTRNPTELRAGLLLRSTTPKRSQGLVVKNLTVERVDSNPSGRGQSRSFGGIVVLSAGAGFTGVSIEGSVVRSSGRTGIAVTNPFNAKHTATDVRITGNRVEWARGDSIIMIGVNKGRIDHNVSANGSNVAPCPVKLCGKMGGPTTASAAIWPAQSTDIRIDHNEVYGEHANAGDGAGIDVDLYARNIVIEQNYLHGNAGGGVMFCGARDTIVRNNVLQYNLKSAFAFTCGWKPSETVRNITITNNTVVQGGAKHPAYYVVRNIHPNPGKTLRFTNNIVSCAGACAYTWPTRPTAAANTYLGTWSRTEPRGSYTTHGGRPLRAPGTGKNGFGSLGGYHLRGKPAYGVKISGTGVQDVFGRDVNEKRPVRGAAVK